MPTLFRSEFGFLRILRVAEISFPGYAVSMSTTNKVAEFSTDNPPSPAHLSKLEKLSLDAVAKALGIPQKPREERVHRLSPKQEAELREIEANAIAEFQGDLTQLEAALGMLRLGHHFGWRALYIMHSKKTVRTYEDILGIKIRDVFDETGPSSYRSFGLNIALRFSNFWKVVGGDTKIPRRQEVSK